ncbi:MAG: tRNA epoxyqueuosine(34) reductase QueG [Bryobacterales bacterium]|nr:tRNA epoxyqueuosine(34) reductase QueG [Bryobacterales bacterium]MBV9400566.1 tRNA epoxyqueuosine(34) reductase QueG [Bryobacterales bacterium]
MDAATVKRIASECGFELAGIAPALPVQDFDKYRQWVERGFAGEMRYLADHRRGLRADPRNLLAGAKTVICAGKLYNTSRECSDPAISRYAWGQDYHTVLRGGLEQMARRLTAIEPFNWKICVDTAPLLERSYARMAGLGWIGKNTCLINEPQGSWFFLGELITSLDLELDTPPPDRCGTCTRCIDACPTQAIVPDGGAWTIDSRRCIAYLTIELRGPAPAELAAGIGHHVFGCDICQEVCPWNSRAPVTQEPAFQPREIPPLSELADLTEQQFREFARGTPLGRPKHEGFLRNIRVARENAGIADTG